MADINLKKLNRMQLLEMLIEQGKELERLKEENAQLKEKLENRTMEFQECGNLAEAVLKVNRVMEAAQAAADEYLKQIKCMRTADEE